MKNFFYAACVLSFILAIRMALLESSGGETLYVFEDSNAIVDTVAPGIDNKATNKLASNIPRVEREAAENKKSSDKDKRDVESFRSGLDSYWNSRRSVDKESTRESLYKSLSAKDNPMYLALSSRVLTDHLFLATNFEEDQSIARMFAIDYLRYSLSQPQHRKSVEKTIAGVARLYRKESNRKRVDLDLEQLVYYYVKSNPVAFIDRYEDLIPNMGINYANKTIFDDAIAMALANNPSDAEAVTHFIETTYAENIH